MAAAPVGAAVFFGFLRAFAGFLLDFVGFLLDFIGFLLTFSWFLLVSEGISLAIRGFRASWAQTAGNRIHTQKIACNLLKKSKKQA